MKNILSPSASPFLCRQVLGKVFLFGVLIVSVATVTCYYQVFNRSEDKTLSYLKQYMVQRSRQENQAFTLAHKRLEFFKKEFMRMYLSDVKFTTQNFWDLYFTDKDGATRMKKKFFNEYFDDRLGRQWGMTSFIGNNQPVVSNDFQRRLIISSILVNRYGPAWYPEGMLHVTYPENAIMIFCPEYPWGLNARPDLPMNELGTIKATLQSENPKRNPVWTGLYFDETAKTWTITYEIPVDYKGQHLINPSMDVRLESIMNRLDSDRLEGAYNFIIREDGYLIAHPGELKDEQKWKGQLSLDKIDNPDIVRMYQKISADIASPGQDIAVIDDVEGDNYLLASFIPGPDWWFVMVYPKKIIAGDAHYISRIVLLLGFSLFILYYVFTYYIILKQVHFPLQRLQQAVLLVTRGKYKEVSQFSDYLPLEQKNEIGQLAKAFLNMSSEVDNVNSNLQNLVDSRTKELQEANSKLRDLSMLDGLTGIYNRRSFDRDIKQIFKQAKNEIDSFSILMADVDHFKAYNDTYGHTTGDDVLRSVAAVIAENIRKEDRVYRYGGEEFIVIFNNYTQEFAQQAGSRILSAVQSLAIPHEGSKQGVITISAGLVEYQNKFEKVTDMINAADTGLYKAKLSGRNCLQVSTAATVKS